MRGLLHTTCPQRLAGACFTFRCLTRCIALRRQNIRPAGCLAFWDWCVRWRGTVRPSLTTAGVFRPAGERGHEFLPPLRLAAGTLHGCHHSVAPPCETGAGAAGAVQRQGAEAHGAAAARRCCARGLTVPSVRVQSVHCEHCGFADRVAAGASRRPVAKSGGEAADGARCSTHCGIASAHSPSPTCRCAPQLRQRQGGARSASV